MDKVNRGRQWRHWLMLAVSALLAVLVASLVDLKPVVEENFFFSHNDPQFQAQVKIDKIFPSRSELVVSVIGPHIGSAHYLDRLGELTRQIQAIPGVTSADSLTDGPKDFEDAQKSPSGGGF